MSGHTSVLSLGSIIDAPIRRHYNSIRPCPEAATTLAPLRRPTLWFIWRGHRTRVRSRRGGFGRSIWPRFGWPDGLIYLRSRSLAGDAGTSTPSGSGDAGSDGRRIGGGARKSRSGVGLSRYRRSGVTEATDIFIADQHWLPLLLADVWLLLSWPTFPIPPYIQRTNQPSQDRVRLLSSVRAELSLIPGGLSRCHLNMMMESVPRCLVRCKHLRKPALPAPRAIAS